MRSIKALIFCSLLFCINYSRVGAESEHDFTNHSHKTDLFSPKLSFLKKQETQKELNVLANKDNPDVPCPSKIRLSALGSTENRGIFYIDYLLPIYYSEDQSTLLFLNPKQNLFTPYALETNLGTGFRKIFSDKYILGLHFFYDKKYSRKNKLYSQLGYGFEFLSQPFDLRFNYYDPKTKAKVIDSGYELGDMYLVHWNSYEEPLEGYDFEVGFPIVPQELKTRIYFGGFFFNSHYGKDVNGYRIRSETDINKWLAIDMTINSKNAAETEFIGGFRVTIPLELGRVKNNRNRFRGIPKDSYIKERLFERVVRDIDVQTKSQGTTQKENQADVEMIYVNNSNNTGTEDGTLTYPYTSIESALGDGRYFGNGGTAKYIYVAKGSGDYAGGFTLNSGTVLWGSAYNGGFKGLTATDYPVISGGENVIEMANNNTIQGLRIQDGTNGIYAENKTDGVIRNNYITGNSRGIYIYTDTGETTDFTISGNTISDNQSIASGIDIHTSNGATIADLTISNNTISGNGGYGIDVYNDGGINSGFTISGNIISDNASVGIRIGNQLGDPATSISGFVISNNTISGNIAGISIYTCDGNLSDFTISKNVISGNTYSGIGVTTLASTTSDFTISRNTITGNAVLGGDAAGISIDNTLGSNLSDFTISENVISENTKGIRIENESDSIISGLTITENTVSQNTGYGIAFLNSWPLGLLAEITDTAITGNTISGNTSSGIYISNTQESSGPLNFVISGNVITENVQDGIELSESYNNILAVDIGGGELSSEGLNSIYGNNTGGGNYYDIQNDTGAGIDAKNNWWGQSQEPDSNQFHGDGVNYTPWLISAPN